MENFRIADRLDAFASLLELAASNPYTTRAYRRAAEMIRGAAVPVADRVRAAWVDRHARKGKGPSDHAPVIVDLDEAPDGDIGPVVPPPSAPAARRGSVKLPQAP